MKVIHPFCPIYDKNSKILILGSFPSVKSREDNFYYAHKQNRFWQVLKSIYGYNKELVTKEDKIEFLLNVNVAIWDIIKECDIVNSDDSSIKNVIPNDIESIIKKSNIKSIFCNGKKSYNIFKKYFKLEAKVLPSTSPANASYSLDKLIEIWGENLTK